MRLFLIPLLVSCNTLFAQTTEKTLPLKFGNGDSLVFNLRNYGCFNPGSLHQLIFIRNGECVEVIKQYSSFENQIPSISERINISYAFLKDTLFKRLRDFKKIDNLGWSTNKMLYYVHNNRNTVTIREKHLRVVARRKDVGDCCIIEAPDFPQYLDEMLQFVIKSFKTNNKASCNYKPPVIIPAQGEN